MWRSSDQLQPRLAPGVRETAGVRGDDAYYRTDLALVHHLGFGGHAHNVAAGILELLRDVRARDGLVVELGCGSGLLTRYLVDAGHRVLATDASSAMLDLARAHASGAQGIEQLVLPNDPIPGADAIVSIGHMFSYLSTPNDIDRALVAAAEALRPDGVFAIDLCDLTYVEAQHVPRRQDVGRGRLGVD